MSSKIFEEAIADAKKLKEVAEDNAKKAILEAVTPRIREFIEDQLLEDYAGEKDDPESDVSVAEEAEMPSDELDEEVVLDESALQSLISLLGGEEILNELGVDSNTEVVKESVIQTLGSFDDDQIDKLKKIANKFNTKADLFENRLINNNEDLNQENTNMSNREKFYEVDLQSLREAIEDEMKEFDHSLEETEEPMHELYEDEDEDEETSEMQGLMNELRLILDLGEDVEAEDLPEMLRGMVEEDEEGDEEVELEDADDAPAEEPEEMDDEALDAEMESLLGGEEAAEDPAMNEVFEVDPRMLRQELSRMRRLVKEGKVDHHFGGKGEGKVGVDGSFGGKGKSNAGVKGVFGGGKEGQDVFTNPPQMNKLSEAIRDLRRKNRAQAEKLNKYRGAIDTLREQLEDLNLFNAKLLYVNKLLQNKSLTESQKKSVIKALDEANTLSETKTLYKSLTESLATPKGTINESTRYGSSSRTTTSASSTRTQETSDLGRWQKLAGLK